jgi:molybdopterin converting factor small subunit
MTLRDLLAVLSEGAGQAYWKAIYDKVADRMNEYLTVFVNSREVRSLRGLDTILEQVDVVTIMPPMAGGAAWPRV